MGKIWIFLHTIIAGRVSIWTIGRMYQKDTCISGKGITWKEYWQSNSWSFHSSLCYRMCLDLDYRTCLWSKRVRSGSKLMGSQVDSDPGTTSTTCPTDTLSPWKPEGVTLNLWLELSRGALKRSTGDDWHGSFGLKRTKWNFRSDLAFTDTVSFFIRTWIIQYYKKVNDTSWIFWSVDLYKINLSTQDNVDFESAMPHFHFKYKCTFLTVVTNWYPKDECSF